MDEELEGPEPEVPEPEPDSTDYVEPEPGPDDPGDDDPEPEPESLPTTVVSPSLPPIPLPDVLTDAEVEELRAEGFSDRAIAIMGQVGLRAAQRMEGSMLQGASVYEQTMQTAPEYARLVGPRVRQHLSTLRPEVRQTQIGLNLAMASAILEEANATPDDPTAFINALVRHAGLAKGQRPVVLPATAKTPTQQPGQRLPTPSVSPQARRNVATDRNLANRAQAMLGTTRAAIEDIFAEDN